MELEMPTPCTECGEIFELLDGRRNPRGGNVVICSNCADKADEEIERDEEIQTLRSGPQIYPLYSGRGPGDASGKTTRRPIIMYQKYSDEAYLTTEFFEDRDVEIRCQSRKILVTKKPHRCAYADVICDPHEIPPGSRVVCERGIVEEQWGAWYSCLNCLDAWIDEINR